MNWLRRMLNAKKTEAALDAALAVIDNMVMHVQPIPGDDTQVQSEIDRLKAALREIKHPAAGAHY